MLTIKHYKEKKQKSKQTSKYKSKCKSKCKSKNYSNKQYSNKQYSKYSKCNINKLYGGSNVTYPPINPTETPIPRRVYKPNRRMKRSNNETSNIIDKYNNLEVTTNETNETNNKTNYIKQFIIKYKISNNLYVNKLYKWFFHPDNEVCRKKTYDIWYLENQKKIINPEYTVSDTVIDTVIDNIILCLKETNSLLFTNKEVLLATLQTYLTDKIKKILENNMSKSIYNETHKLTEYDDARILYILDKIYFIYKDEIDKKYSDIAANKIAIFLFNTNTVFNFDNYYKLRDTNRVNQDELQIIKNRIIETLIATLNYIVTSVKTDENNNSNELTEMSKQTLIAIKPNNNNDNTRIEVILNLIYNLYTNKITEIVKTIYVFFQYDSNNNRNNDNYINLNNYITTKNKQIYNKTINEEAIDAIISYIKLSPNYEIEIKPFIELELKLNEPNENNKNNEKNENKQYDENKLLSILNEFYSYYKKQRNQNNIKQESYNLQYHENLDQANIIKNFEDQCKSENGVCNNIQTKWYQRPPLESKKICTYNQYYAYNKYLESRNMYSVELATDKTELNNSCFGKNEEASKTYNSFYIQKIIPINV